MSRNKESPPPSPMPVVVCSGAMHSHAVRIPPNADLVPSLLSAAQQAMQQSPQPCQSAFVMTAVGSLTEVTLRMAATADDDDKGVSATMTTKKSDCHNDGSGNDNKKQKTNPSLTETTTRGLRIRTYQNHYEIVSLVGTFAAVEDTDTGSLVVTQKHLHMSVSDSDGVVMGGHLISGRVYTTLELVLGTMSGVAFTREVLK